jgi:hypothetical protein
MFVYFTTVNRSAPIEQGGELIKIDWDHNRILNSTPIVPSHLTPDDLKNTRGGARGGRGIIFHKNRIFVASYNSIQIYDQDLRLQKLIEHHLFKDIHEIERGGQHQKIWVTSTGKDALVEISDSGEIINKWSPFNDPELTDILKPISLHQRKFNDADVNPSDNISHVHLNAVTFINERPIILLNHNGCVVKLHPTEILIKDDKLKGAHNLLVSNNDELIINNTRCRRIEIYTTAGKPIRAIEIDQFDFIKKILRKHTLTRMGSWMARNGRPYRIFHPIFKNCEIAKPVFVRGLCLIRDTHLLVGISPASILEIDLTSGRFIKAFQYSANKNVCVHGLTC